MKEGNINKFKIAAIIILSLAVLLLVYSIIWSRQDKNRFRQEARAVSDSNNVISEETSLDMMDDENQDMINVNQSTTLLSGTYFQKKGIMLRKEGKYQEALKEFENAEEVSPHKPGIWHSKALTYLRMGKIDDALHCLDKSIKLAPTPRVWYLKGLILGFRADYKNSLKAFDESLKLKPSVSAWFGKGNTLQDMERREEAIQCYDQALKIDDRAPAVWYYRGVILDQLNRYEEAKVSFKKASSLNYQRADEALEALKKKGL